MHADILLRDLNDHPVAIIEAKGLMHLTPAIAADIHRRMVRQGLPTHIPYFLLVSQDHGYLWQAAAGKGASNDPTVEFSMQNVTSRYLSSLPHVQLRGVQLELLLMRWLNDLAAGKLSTADEPERTLHEVGFLDAIRNARITHEAPL